MKEPNGRKAWAWTLAAGALSCGASAGIINPGFETGDFSGWEVDRGTGWAYVTSIGEYEPPYGIPLGHYMAVLGAGDGDNVYTTASQTFTLRAGDTLRGCAAFSVRHRYVGNFSDAYVSMSGPAGDTVLWSAAYNNSPGESLLGMTYDSIDRLWLVAGWTAWTFTAPTSDNYTLSYGCRQGPLVEITLAMFDAEQLVRTPDHGASLVLLSVGVLGLTVMRRAAGEDAGRSHGA